MTSLPEWPDGLGPRILTLAGNNLTIDTRARKTASSLARAGFSVIAIGIDELGNADPTEHHDGAVLARMVPPANPRISSRLIRLSRAELRESMRYRVEIQRQRLQMGRRSLIAWSAWQSAEPSRLTRFLSRLWAGVLRRTSKNSAERAALQQRFDHRTESVDARIRMAPRKARVIATQRRHQLLTMAYKALAKNPKWSLGRGSWRRDLPEQQRFEAALGSVVDMLEPDLIHCHDIFHLGVASRAKARRKSRGQDMKLIYDAQEFIAGLPSDPVRRAAYTDLEEEYFGRADAVLTVSESLADLLEGRYGVRPAIVMNAPDMETARETEPLRSVAGVAEDSPLITYVGGIAPHRGAETLLDAMMFLPDDAHLVFVSNSTTGYVAQLLETAASTGINGRVHVVPYVAPEAVVSYIRSADVSVIPLRRDVVNYEVALPNKLFQSIHASVPVAVSDNPEMARFVREHGVGEVFVGGEPKSMADAIMNILENHRLYESRLSDPGLLDSLSWRQQAANLIKVYGSLGVSVP